MKLYFSTIGIAMAVISAVNIGFKTATWYYVIISTVWCAALQFALDGIVALTVRLTPDRWYRADSPLFEVSDRQRRLYQRLGVRKWKDKVWELGGIGGFSKRSLEHPDDPAYIEKYIIECNRGTVTHRLSYPIGFLAMLTLRGSCALTVALPVAVVNLYLNILPTIVLRYNLPMLKRMLRRLSNKTATPTAVGG